MARLVLLRGSPNRVPADDDRVRAGRLRCSRPSRALTDDACTGADLALEAHKPRLRAHEPDVRAGGRKRGGHLPEDGRDLPLLRAAERE